MNDFAFKGFSSLDDDDKLLIKNIGGYIQLSEKRHGPMFTFFLNEREISLINKYLESIKFSSFTFYGGFENATRRVLGIYPENTDVDFNDFPITPVTFNYRKTDVIKHKDVLGSVLSLQIARKSVGDIVINDGICSVFVYNTILNSVFEIDKIGKIGVKAVEGFYAKYQAPAFKEMKGTVASLRLDCIVSYITGLSREKSANLIKSLGVTINYDDCFDGKTQVSPGDIISVRRYGKFIFESVDGKSRKERIYITIKKYV